MKPTIIGIDENHVDKIFLKQNLIDFGCKVWYKDILRT